MFLFVFLFFFGCLFYFSFYLISYVSFFLNLISWNWKMFLIQDHHLMTSQMLKNSTMMINFDVFVLKFSWFRSAPSLILSRMFCFAGYTSCLSRIPALLERSLVSRRPYLLFLRVRVPIRYVVLYIFLSWLLEQVSRSSNYFLTFRSLRIYFFVIIIKTIASSQFFTTFFENCFILYDPLPIPFFLWDGFCITIASSYIFVRCHF